jgi:hypothetical protein
MASDASKGDESTPAVVEIPANRVEGVITLEDIAARLAERQGDANVRAADLAQRLAQELGKTPPE